MKWGCFGIQKKDRNNDFENLLEDRWRYEERKALQLRIDKDEELKKIKMKSSG